MAISSPLTAIDAVGDLGDDRLGRRLRSSRADDRPADDEIVGACRDRARRRHDALLVAGVGAGRPDARRHEHHVGADDRRSSAGLLGRADDAVDADVARLLRARCGTRSLDADRIAGLRQVGVVIGGQHRHGENAQLRPRPRLDRRPHGLRIGMHGQEGRAEPRDALDARARPCCRCRAA